MWKLSLDESSNTASTVPAEPQLSVKLSVFLFPGSAAAGPAARTRSVAAAASRTTTRRMLASFSWAMTAHLRGADVESAAPQEHRIGEADGSSDAAGATAETDNSH